MDGSLSISVVKKHQKRQESQSDFGDIVVNISKAERNSFDHFNLGVHAFGKGVGGAPVKIIQYVGLPLF